MNIFIGEILGTFLLVLLGDGVVANVLLNRTKGQNGGWIVITFGWAIAVFVGVFVSAKASGAHLNPAITIPFAILVKISWSDVPIYLGGQMIGGMLGALVMWSVYWQHFRATEDVTYKLGVFATIPAIRNNLHNFISEMVGTFVLVLAVLLIINPSSSLGALDALPVALLILGIGLSLGGSTGYAINPVRDLAPRIMHAILPIGKKGTSDWGYAWIPVFAPMVGGVLAALLYMSVLK
jgi:glycerol uptake facilitator protein